MTETVVVPDNPRQCLREMRSTWFATNRLSERGWRFRYGVQRSPGKEVHEMTATHGEQQLAFRLVCNGNRVHGEQPAYIEANQ